MTVETYLNWTSADDDCYAAESSIFKAAVVDQGCGRWIAVVESGQFSERRGFPTKDEAMVWCESTVFRLAKELVELSKLERMLLW